MSDTTICLWALFLEAVMEIHHVEEAMCLLKAASKGLFKEILHLKNPADTSSHQINYKAILREIRAYYNLSCQIVTCNERDHVPDILFQRLTV